MSILNIALLQLISTSSQKANMQKGIEYCRRAKAMGADLALFPEMWNIGYNFPHEISELKANAVDNKSEFVTSFQLLAKELNMAIAITYLEKYEPLPKNTVTLFDRLGNCALHYSKVHTCDFDMETEHNITPGEDFYVADLDTGNDVIKIGSMICYDREFPESARILMLKGAEIVLVPNACPMEINRLTQLRARAFENMIGIATANYAIGQPDCNGHSTAFDGIAWSEDDSHDMLLIEAGESEGIYMAQFPIDKLREYRETESFGNAYRKPSKYGMIISDTVEKPFIRNDARR
jgi:predicted amidohydrolase